ncbi:hypothetical protein Daus18300_000570 [Diaporthe australafricana]|uniref:Rhodopsin domain-containing protein n=1 Tax=Diaporthe australafricana TaxID=127596 RepID=A0ABR3Y3P1_9PEZI
MAFQVFQVPDQGAYLIVLIVCAVSCIAAVALRFMATHRVNRKPAAEDWFALVAVLVFLVRIVSIVTINGRSLPDLILDKQDLENAFKAFWDPLAPGQCMAWTTIMLATEPPNSLIDFGLVALAMAMIRSLRLKPDEKWRLRFLFALGGL